jgi:hypothetical protein
MRPLWIGFVVILLAAACSPSRAPTSRPGPPSSSAHPRAVNPANIKRVSRELPPGYEVSGGVPSAASPRVNWGLEPDVLAKPPQCGVLADPGNGRDQSAQGISGSGAGGIVDAVVVALTPGPAVLDASLAASCGQWTMSDGHSKAGVRLIDPPRIDGAETLGMVADVKTSVEAGTEIDSRTYTFIAYLDGYYAFTTLTTDPGSALPALPPQFAADLLVKTASTLRS